MTRVCNEVGGVNMGQGICDVPTPSIVKEMSIRAVQDDRSIYTRYDGDEPLRQALASKLSSYNGIKSDAETEVVVTVGASGALTSTLVALCNPGDRILLFEPYYGYHLNTATVCGMQPVFMPLSAPTFELDFNAIEDEFKQGLRAIIVNTPVNPSGKVFTRQELVTLLALCRQYDVLMITDEVYEYMTYGDHEHVSAGSLPGAYGYVVTIGSYSKTFSITGWRIGYATAAAPLAAAIGLVNDLYYICAAAPLQLAVAEGIRKLPAEYYSSMSDAYELKRKQFCDVLDEVGLQSIRPNGAYYVLADVSSLGHNTAKAAAMQILTEAKVASVPGSAFYSDSRGEKLTRFCYAKRQTDIDRACEQLLAWSRTR